MKQKILVIDFGSQVTKLIVRRIRELGVYCEISTVKDLNKLDFFDNINGLILSGGPATVTKKNSPKFQKKYFHSIYPFLEFVMDCNLLQKNLGVK